MEHPANLNLNARAGRDGGQAAGLLLLLHPDGAPSGKGVEGKSGAENRADFALLMRRMISQHAAADPAKDNTGKPNNLNPKIPGDCVVDNGDLTPDPNSGREQRISRLVEKFFQKGNDREDNLWGDDIVASFAAWEADAGGKNLPLPKETARIETSPGKIKRENIGNDAAIIEGSVSAGGSEKVSAGIEKFPGINNLYNTGNETVIIGELIPAGANLDGVAAAGLPHFIARAGQPEASPASARPPVSRPNPAGRLAPEPTSREAAGAGQEYRSLSAAAVSKTAPAATEAPAEQSRMHPATRTGAKKENIRSESVVASSTAPEAAAGGSEKVPAGIEKFPGINNLYNTGNETVIIGELIPAGANLDGVAAAGLPHFIARAGQPEASPASARPPVSRPNPAGRLAPEPTSREAAGAGQEYRSLSAAAVSKTATIAPEAPAERSRIHPESPVGRQENIPVGNRHREGGADSTATPAANHNRPNIPQQIAGTTPDRKEQNFLNLQETAVPGTKNAETAHSPLNPRPESTDHLAAGKTAPREQGGADAGSAMLTGAKDDAATKTLRAVNEQNMSPAAPATFEEPAPVVPTLVDPSEGTSGKKTARKDPRPEALPGGFPPVRSGDDDVTEAAGPAARRQTGDGWTDKEIFREGLARKTEEHRRGPGKTTENGAAEEFWKLSYGDVQNLRSDRPAAPGATAGNIPASSVMNQVRDGMVQGFKDGGRVRITLYPESLGRVDMDIVVRHDRVELVMKVDNEQVRQLLHSHVDDLKTTLQNQGWQVQGVDVSLQKDNNPADGRNFANMFSWQERRNQDQQRGGSTSGAGGGAPAAGMVDNALETAVKAETKVKGLSIFA